MSALRKIENIGSVEKLESEARGRLKDSLVEHLYRRFFKRSAIARNIATKIWRTGLAIRTQHMLRAQSISEVCRTYPLVSQAGYCKENAQQVKVISKGEPVELPVLLAASEKDQKYLKPIPSTYEFSGTYISRLKDAYVIGGSNFVLHKGNAVVHDGYNFENDFTREEESGLFQITARTAQLTFSPEGLIYSKHRRAAVFLDSLSTNYFHWLGEVLARFALFCEFGDCENTTILIDEHLHSNMHESLEIVAGKKLNICTLSAGQVLKISDLHLVSSAGYIPFNERRGASSDGQNGVIGEHMCHLMGRYSPLALQTLMRRVVSNCPSVTSEHLPKRIFLRRNSPYRVLKNWQEIEHALIAQGFTIIEPETLSFSEQVRLFSQAEKVVSIVGAACANLLFCSPSTQLTFLIGRGEGIPYCFWPNFAAALGNTVEYVFGDTLKSASTGCHADIEVQLEDLLRTIGSV